MPKTFTCRDCGEEFREKPTGSKGYVNQCLTCSAKEKEPEPIGGNMIYLHKTGGYVELKPMREAKAFAKATARRNHGVTQSLVQVRNPHHFGSDD